MPRELRMAVAAPAMAPMASATAVISFKSLLRLVTKPELIVKVIAAWVVWLILRQLQSILGPMRHRSRHCVVQYGAMAAYYLPTVIAFYTANAVQSSPDTDLKVALSIGCSLLLFACARGAVTMTAFTLDGGPRILQSWQLLPYLLYFTWQQWGWIWLDHQLTVPEIYNILVFAAPAIYVLLAKPRSRSAILDEETKKFADYMMRESSRSSLPSALFHGDGDASSRLLYDRCRYPFMQQRDGGWIKFSDVLQLQQRDRFPRDCAMDPDICLSYSFCRLLARRYFRFPCPEDGNEQVRDFVLTELLADWNRGFTIVEVQLALLHDYFFTNYHSNITSGLVSVRQGTGVALKVSLLFLVGYALAYLIRNTGNYDGSDVVFISAFAVPVLLMYIVIAQPEYPLLPRHWHPIRNVFLYYSTATGTASSPSVIDHFHYAAPPPRSQSSRLPYWRDKIGQYSVIEDYDRRSYKKTFLAWCKVHVLSHVSYSFVTHHPAEGEDVQVPDSVKRFLARTIKEMNCPKTICPRSLDANHKYNGSMLDDLSWTCRQETLTDVILMWHVATCYCDMMSEETLEEDVPHRTLQEGSTSQSLEEPSTGYRKLAITLSKYCAYLVAFLPELLPEHSLTVKVVFQRVLQQPRDLLGRTNMSMAEKRRKIQELHLPEDMSSLTTFERGVQLGRQLEQQTDVSLRWKVMADFWAEMILYAASSDNAAAHIEQLAQGGEFVTHLWALLCNAGILKAAAEEGTPQHPEDILSHPNMVREEKPSIIFLRRTVSATA